MLGLTQFFLGRSGSADAHLFVELPTVGGEDDGVQGLGQLDGEGGLARGSGASDDDEGLV